MFNQDLLIEMQVIKNKKILKGLKCYFYFYSQISYRYWVGNIVIPSYFIYIQLIENIQRKFFKTIAYYKFSIAPVQETRIVCKSHG